MKGKRKDISEREQGLKTETIKNKDGTEGRRAIQRIEEGKDTREGEEGKMRVDGRGSVKGVLMEGERKTRG